VVCPDNNAMLVGEEICYEINDALKVLLSDRREMEKCSLVDIK
jgi:hypothetical protein